jgi:GH35 family endo-1,4-beta-xylanase
MCVLLLSAVALIFCGCSSDDNKGEVEKVTVKFDLNGAHAPQNISNITIEKGTALGDQFPKPPTRNDGWGFVGWFIGGVEGVEYRADTSIKSNITLKAEWNYVAPTGMSLEDFMVTIFSSQPVKPVFDPPTTTDKRITCTSDNPEVVSVSSDGIVTAHKYTNASTGTGTATITVTTVTGGFTDTCVVTATMAGQVYITDVPPLKESFKDYFMMGNIFDPYDVPDEKPYAITTEKPWLTYHNNTLTHQNHMKPSMLCGNERGSYNEGNMAAAKRMIAAAAAEGIKIQGHCLLWHQQIPRWQSDLRTSDASNDEILSWLREYIKYIVNEFRGTIYAWDVLNEAFSDGARASDNWRNVMRSGATDGNPWYMRLGADFVYEGFLAAREEDPEIILYYNDYNLDGVGKATMVRNMVRDVNARYAQEHPEANGRKLIEGIGMQSHHNADVTAASIQATLNLFRPLDVKISVSEFDLLAQRYSEYSASNNTTGSTVTIPGLLNQANQYGQYFKVFLDNADIIERITFWGSSDSNNWRSRGQPMPFDREFRAKPAYYKIIEALEAKKAEE